MVNCLSFCNQAPTPEKLRTLRRFIDVLSAHVVLLEEADKKFYVEQGFVLRKLM